MEICDEKVNSDLIINYWLEFKKIFVKSDIKIKKTYDVKKNQNYSGCRVFVPDYVAFPGFYRTLHAWLGWMAEVQFLPAVLALNVGVVIFLLILTLIFGRVYCSVICPMGVMQDVVTWLGGRSKKRRYRFSYSPQKRILRFVVLAVFLVTLVAGINSVVALLAPYSAYGRIAQNILSPVYAYGNNLLAYFAERADSYAFYRTDVWIRSIPTFVVAVLTLSL